jgi:DNA polymerase III epsilon subunit-like protein
VKIVFPDTETTGLDRSTDQIIELAVLRIDWPSWRVDGVYYQRFRPTCTVHPDAATVNGYTPEAWQGSPEIDSAAAKVAFEEFAAFVSGCRWLGSMPQFDWDMIENARRRLKLTDRLPLSNRRLWCVNSLASPLTFAGRVEKGGLDELCSVLGIGDPGEGAGFAAVAGGRTGPHTAMGDALRCVRVLRRLLGGYLAAGVIAAILGEGEAAKGGESVTEEELAEIERRCAEATPGPWQVNRFDNDGGEINWQVQQVPRPSEVIANVTDDEPKRAKHDAAFVAHAREDLPAAIAEIERLNRLVVATANADPSWVERCTTQAAEIERLATALQAERAAWQEASGADSPGHLTAALKARRARLTAELAARVPALFDGPPRTPPSNRTRSARRQRPP